MLPHFLIDSAGYRLLSLKARCTFVELLRIYNGSNNGKLVLSVRRLADRMRTSKDTASKALRELEDAGFIKTRQASEYRIMHLRCDVTHELPVKNFNRPKQ